MPPFPEYCCPILNGPERSANSQNGHAQPEHFRSNDAVA
jgi:hypothetical protein